VLALRAPAAPAPAPTGRWSDGELLALLRQPLGGRPRTVADLVVESGISIARAERVYRFWLTRDLHPLAQRARGSSPESESESESAPARPPAAPPPPAAAPHPERRSSARLARAALIAQLRDPDPRVRAAAFDELRAR
jgi:hypothetical protein